ncbi:aldehyde dehydrogenase (NADP(+)) [Nakamurella antarctica]|uniref:Aldehyde dehydrogenase (NADP(+)) n=2 Tax=Nakamurella antarctica TaxID=1902245 RepID=A0A3G8ZKV7_9ACTN|nr:aldehyde dehydrogenase (NADP(+)) [Nakamurella antarctica]
MTASTAADTAALIEAAHSAFLKGQAASPAERAEWLTAIATTLDANAEELIGLAAEETHLATARLTGELTRTAFQLRLLAEEITAGFHLDATIDHSDASWGMGPRPDIRRMNVPLGVVGVFGASNFPFAFSVIGGDSSSALAAGAAVVHKIHSAHLKLGLRTSELVSGALAAAGAPQGLFGSVVGRAAAEMLVDHPLVKAVGFTGSTAGGRALFDRACARPVPIPFFGELGSINPVVVTQKAWARRGDQILREFAMSFTMGMGQFCTKPGLLFVPAGDWDQISSALSGALLGSAGTEMLSDGLHEAFEESLRAVAAEDGVSVIVQGRNAPVPLPSVLGTTSAVVRNNPSILHREMFGPASLVVQYETEDELPALVELLEGQLTATLQAEDDDDLGDLVGLLREKAGRLLWNGWPTGVTVSYAQQHGGPYPATTSASSSVGTSAIARFMRPVAFQSFPAQRLPMALRDDNPWRVVQRVNGSVASQG